MPIFKNKKGQLTKYALACGYQEINEKNKTGIITRLYSEANGYHVRQHDHKQGIGLCWETFTKLTEARKFYNSIIKSAKSI